MPDAELEIITRPRVFFEERSDELDAYVFPAEFGGVEPRLEGQRSHRMSRIHPAFG